jgi:hypothetical protein
MMPILSPLREPSLLSPRTAKYVDAMIREGDSFDYDRWLKSVREEEAEAKQLSAPSTTGQTGAAQIGNRISRPDSRDGWPRPALMTKAAPMPRAIRRSSDHLSSTTSKDRLTRWLQKVQAAGQDFQTNRARDAVYHYLEAVFAIVMHYKVRRRTRRLLRRAFELAELPFDKNADPFTTIIRCTCGDAADNKMISKWARALRYAARRKPAGMRLKVFMKGEGGVNQCAAGYAKQRHRHHQPPG